MLFIALKSLFVFCDKSDNVIDGTSENVNGVKHEGENVDNNSVSDKEKEQVNGVENGLALKSLEVKRDKATKNMDNDFVSDKEVEQAGSVKNGDAHKKWMQKGIREQKNGT